MNVYTLASNKIIKHWGPIIDNFGAGSLTQFEHLAACPFTFRAPVSMPDNHVGYGMPIGGVWATKDVIVPNAVGVDIGCGMAGEFLDAQGSIKSIDPESPDALKSIIGHIRRLIPVGMKHHDDDQPLDGWSVVPDGITEQEYIRARRQVGTLGGGNHFIEIQRVVGGDQDGQFHVMIHSGSRNLGKRVCDFYNDIAKKLNEKWHTVVPKEWDLAFLPINSTEGQMYLREMQSCVEFASLNRERMMAKVMEIFAHFGIPSVGKVTQSVHNFARLEHHFGANVWVHRKGATPADEGRICLIPGSQGTSSYIGVGLGNDESYNTCSHGAGRVMGRKEATRKLNLEDEQKRLNDLGVLHSIRGTDDLDEAPGAYKDIDEVMANQSDLVRIQTKLQPVAVVKG